jgi:ribulose-bisphosphate carboxylase small chain
MWKLPMFGEQSVDTILAEVEACKQENPGHLVRLIGYDNYAQCQGTSMLVHKG